MRIGKNSLLGLLFVSIVLLLNACVIVVKDSPNGYPPAHTASSYAYWYYYPNSQVYYHVTEHYYYYRDGQRWIKATALPAGWVLNQGYRVRLKIAGRPYRQHARHKRLYPPRHRSANGPGKGHHGDDHGKHQINGHGKDHGKGHGLFGKLTRFKTDAHNQQHKPEHANHGKGPNKGHQSEHASRGKGLNKRHQPEHANRGRRPNNQHKLEHARAKGHMAPAKPNSGKSHGKPAKKAGAIARGQVNPAKGGSQKAKRPMGQRQPQGLRAKASHGQGSAKHTPRLMAIYPLRIMYSHGRPPVRQVPVTSNKQRSNTKHRAKSNGPRKNKRAKRRRTRTIRKQKRKRHWQPIRKTVTP
ncbi:MAG: hypothetical protein P8173_13410 [Gammaproteobacteria bacterium]